MTTKGIRFSPEQEAAIEDFANNNNVNFSNAVRNLIEIGLKEYQHSKKYGVNVNNGVAASLPLYEKMRLAIDVKTMVMAEAMLSLSSKGNESFDFNKIEEWTKKVLMQDFYNL